MFNLAKRFKKSIDSQSYTLAEPERPECFFQKVKKQLQKLNRKNYKDITDIEI